jgi:hypothetical protein
LIHLIDQTLTEQAPLPGKWHGPAFDVTFGVWVVCYFVYLAIPKKKKKATAAS